MCCLLLESKSLSRSQIFSVSLTIWELKNWRIEEQFLDWRNVIFLSQRSSLCLTVWGLKNWRNWRRRWRRIVGLRNCCNSLLVLGTPQQTSVKNWMCVMCVHAGDRNRQGAWCQEATCSQCGDLSPDKHLLPPWGKQNAHTHICTIVHQLAPRILFLLLLGLELGFMLGLEIFCCTRMC